MATLLEEWEHLTTTVRGNIGADYQVKVGALAVDLLREQIETRRLKRHIEILQAAANRGEIIVPEQVTAQLDREFLEWQERLLVQAREVEMARRRLSALLSVEETMELRRLYRKLAKLLHPDVNPHQTERVKSLWLQVRQAYEWCDVEQLRALLLLAGDLAAPPVETGPDRLTPLAQRREAFKERIYLLLEKLARTRNEPPYTLAEHLNDPEWVAAQRKRLKEEIEQEKERGAALLLVLARLEQEGGHEHFDGTTGHFN